MLEGKLSAIIAGCVATLSSGGYVRYLFGKQQDQLDAKVPFELHDQMCGQLKEKFDVVQKEVGDMKDALQGKTGETGLVSAVEAMAVTVEAIREHQKNGG